MKRFRPCIVVPLYDHGDTLAAVVDGLVEYGYPIIVVDDGSAEYTKRCAAEIVAANQELELVTLPDNLGKGGAVMTGLRRAHQRGFSHAVQVDSDGQHDLADLPQLVATAKAAPEALVSGLPVYDDSVPKARLYGRYMTHIWVWIETLSLQIKDTMCGFRVYPVAACIELMDRVRLGTRMDFDTEIAVRLHWRGVRFIGVPTRVVYPEGGISHFAAWRDNLLISWMHTRLFFSMLLRAPMLLARRAGFGAAHWSAVSERGSVLGMRSLLAVHRVLGPAVFKLLLYPVIIYFHLTGGDARRASAAYLERVRTTAADRSQVLSVELSSFQHLMTFAQSALDKIAVWAGDMPLSEIRWADPAIAQAARDTGRGGIVIGSHLGNLEVCRALGHHIDGFKVSALVFTQHAVRFNRILSAAQPAVTQDLIQVSDLGPETLVQLQDRVRAGEFIAIMGDRTAVGNEGRSRLLPFLGEPAAFPEGPWILAALLECPVYLMFSLRQDDGYVMHLEPFADPLALPRTQRAEALDRAIIRYAARLEHHCLSAPLQWFNFFDFWRRPRGMEAD
jgi:predicted LPLAT superfamily acyltransferase